MCSCYVFCISRITTSFTAKIYTTTNNNHLTASFPGLPGSAGTRKVKPIWILLEQETVSGSGISWAICKSAPRSRQITTQVSHHSVFLQAGCPSCRPTNSVKALNISIYKYLLTCIKIHQKLAVSPNENLRLEIETMTTFVVRVIN